MAHHLLVERDLPSHPGQPPPAGVFLATERAARRCWLLA